MNEKPLVSLCMIVGNVEEYIERCMRSFAPISDEICMVRAIGSATPDQTIHIAATLAGELGIPFKFEEYRNANGKDWEHVDNFANARQQSFDMASADYCLWCDSDDVFEGDPEIVRSHAREGAHAAYVFPYKILGLGVSVPRERLIRKSEGRWDYPVHECFRYWKEPINATQDDRVVVVHLPNNTKTGSNERNLRILRELNEEEMHPGLLYHLHGELIGIGDIEGACKVATKAIQHPDLGKAERYELMLVMAKTTKDVNEKILFLHEAYRADPTRREALGCLAGTAIDYGNAEEAICYAQQMRATPAPRRAEWNHRTGFHGYIGDDIYQQALRANGLRDEAEKIRMLAFEKVGGPRISLLHATRGRAQKACLTRKVWFDMADQPERVEHIFVIDSDDEHGRPLKRFHHGEISPGGGCVAAWNHAATLAISPVLVQLSDDWLPCANWDRLILERLGDVSQPKVLAVSDGIRDDQLLCMAICTRAYWFQDCFLFHPSFTGVYSDNHFTAMAYQRGQVIEAKDIVFEHQHPFADSAKWDKTYLEQNAPAQYEHGKAILQRINEGRDWSSVHGFFNFWGLYQSMVHRMQDGDIAVEVGCWMGRSVIFLAQCAQQQQKAIQIYAVDHFKGEKGEPEHEGIVAAHGGSIRGAFEENLQRCGVGGIIRVLEEESSEAAKHLADSSLAFVFIDAAHDYESVKRDINAWAPKIKPGGIIAGHDAHWHEVTNAVLEKWPTANVLASIWWVVL